MTGMPGKANYAGDISPEEAWATLHRHPKAQLVDVRTAPEWNFVGMPDLSGLGRQLHLVEWQTYPGLHTNPDFAATLNASLRAAGAGPEDPVLFLCRSGGRSRAAAIAMTEAGFACAFNVAGGFEGDADAAGRRGARNGWKAAGLPWKQS